MTAVMVRVVRTGVLSRAPGVDSDVCGHTDEPVVFVVAERHGLRVHWRITLGRYREALAEGTTWTKGGAVVAATIAAQRPGITRPEADLRTRRSQVYFCATCAVDDGEEHEPWCHREGVMRGGQ